MLSGVAAGVQAEEVKAVKKTGGQQILDSLSGSVEARLQTFSLKDANGDTQSNRRLALRPKLATDLMNGKLNVSITTPILNQQHSAKTERARPELETNLSLIDKENVTLDIYSFHYLKTTDQAYDGYLDLDLVVKQKLESAAGPVELSMLIEPEANLKTDKVDAAVTRRERPDGLSLSAEAAEAAPVAEQKETNKALNLYPKVDFKPSAVPGLSLAFGAILATTYQPKYVQVISDDGSSSLKDDGYNVSKDTQVRYTVKYQISPDVSVYNQLRQNIAGHFEAGLSEGPRLDNRTGITMNLF
ncbi:MAG: hypothetical protein NT027_09840 [Proteobacteria bacterium]|nr:hypothetical protein [Pseudomonadota bacterium]